MKELFESTVVQVVVGALSFLVGAAFWRKAVAIPRSFEVTETPVEEQPGGDDADAETTAVG